MNQKSKCNQKKPIFGIKKYHRNGLLEKKIMKVKNTLNTGKWTKDEHVAFIRAGLMYGSDWKKVKSLLTSKIDKKRYRYQNKCADSLSRPKVFNKALQKVQH